MSAVGIACFHAKTSVLKSEIIGLPVGMLAQSADRIVSNDHSGVIDHGIQHCLAESKARRTSHLPDTFGITLKSIGHIIRAGDGNGYYFLRGTVA